MCLKIFLDDERFPVENDMVIIRNFDDAISFMDNLIEGPSFVSFDNDLGPDSKEGYEVALWMIEKDLDNDGKWLPNDFEFFVHSQNPVRRDYINQLFFCYFRRTK